MRRIPWHLAFRYTRKGGMTTAGIALGAAFALLSFSVAEALEGDALGLARNYPGTAILVGAPHGSQLPIGELGNDTTGVLLRVGQAADGRPALVAFLVGQEARDLPPGIVRAGVGGAPVGPVSVEGKTLVVDVVAHTSMPRTWLIAHAESAWGPIEMVDLAIVHNASKEREDGIRALGYETERVPGLPGYFAATGVEIARDVTLIVAFSSALAAIFSYEFLRSEIRERRREIGLWRAVGMRSGEVAAIILARAGAMGTIAVVLAAATVFAAIELVGVVLPSASLPPVLDPTRAALVALAFVLATLAGGAAPAFLASKTTVRDLMEDAT